MIKRYKRLNKNLPDNNDKIIYIDGIIVKHKFRHKGYGQALIDEVIKFSKEKIYKSIVAVAVQSNIIQSKINSEKLLLNNDFKRIKDLPNIWSKDIICPICSPHYKTCRCTSVLFTKDI